MTRDASLEDSETVGLNGNYTPGMISVLRHIIENGSEYNRAFLCNAKTTHCASRWLDLFWGCGYRNTQHVLSSILAIESARYEEVFSCTQILGIRDIQAGIEEAWRCGYDVEGAGQLKWKLIGTKKWIGATEVYAFLTHKGFDVDLLEFGGQHCASKLISFCQAHFEKGALHDAAAGVVMTKLHPLYFQQQGHSRTIVGIVNDKRGQALLVFDPAKPISRKVKQLARAVTTIQDVTEQADTGQNTKSDWSKLLKHWKVTETRLKKKQYQLLRINGHLAPAQRELCKVIQPWCL